MPPLTLMYHDILAKDCGPDKSGFKGGGPAVYKIRFELFKEHLECIKQHSNVLVTTVTEGNLTADNLILLTFDDGGCGAMDAADVLEQYDFRGHFFITTDFIDTDGFLTKEQLQQLCSRGHQIGSHSCSHPERMSMLSEEKMIKEWYFSIEKLKQILGAPVICASVPGGYYSMRVARAAEQAGIRYLFTSEPVRKISTQTHCKILGRYTITGSTSLSDVVGLVEGNCVPALKQYLIWNSKKIAKKLGGTFYIKLRKKIFQ